MLIVSDLMTFNPDTITPDAPLSSALATMTIAGYRQLPVLDQGRLVGMITDRDIRLAIGMPILEEQQIDSDERLNSLQVRDYMSTNVVTVSPTTTASRAAAMLSLYKFGALPVLENNVVIGIISVTDFLDYVADQSALAANPR